jgi:hypothetical protein
MADDYAQHALSQRAAFAATHPAVLAAARLFANEPVLRVVDLGAADGVRSWEGMPAYAKGAKVVCFAQSARINWKGGRR